MTTSLGTAAAMRTMNGIPDDLIAEYAAARPASRALIERASAVFPGAETRAVTHYAPFPTVIAHGAGSVLVDVDGLSYVDLANNYTSLVHGNAFAPAREAVTATLSTGTVFPAMTEQQLALGEAIVERIRSVQLIRFTNSGSEAALLAARIARRATGRRKLVMAAGGYHGAFPPFTPGEPEVVRIAYNDVDAVAQIDTDTAAVFMEPFLGAGGVIVAEREFLHAVQQRARDVGAIFVLDEVQSLRNSYHGMQDELGLSPDLTILAKIIGGGLAIGAVGGRSELLELTSPLQPGRLDHGGTLNGHVAAAAAGLASLRHLDRPAIGELNAAGDRLSQRIASAARSASVPVSITRAGSILAVHPGASPVTDTAAAHRSASFRAALHLALLVEGVYATPRGMINLSTALAQQDLDQVVAAYGQAFERLAPDADAMLDTLDEEPA